MSYRLNILGSLDLRDSSGATVNAVLQQPRRLALLIYLALADRDKMVKRDTLLGVFWPDMSQEQGRRALSQAIHFLRKWLGSNAIVGRGNDDVGLNSDLVQCDAARFLAAARSGDLQTATAEFGGDLLPGFFASDSPEFEQWLDATREQLRRTAADVFWSSAEEARQQGQMVTAAACARRAAELASDSESATRRLIEFLDSIDDKAGALDAYDRVVRKLQSEYDMAPSAKTRELAERIRRSAVAEPVERAAAAASTSRLRTLPWREIKRRSRTLAGAGVFMFAFVSLWGLTTRGRVEPMRTDASLAIDAPEVFDAGLRDEASQIVTDASAALVAVPKLKVLAPAQGAREEAAAHFVLSPKFSERDGQLQVSASLVDTETGTLVRSASFKVADGSTEALKNVALDMSEFARREMGRYMRALSVERTEGPHADVLSQAMLARIRSDSLLGEGLSDYAVVTLNRADAALKAALEEDDDPELHVLRAKIAYEKAWAYLLPPLADAAQRNTALSEGLTAAERAIALDPRDAAAHEMRGLLLHRQWLMDAAPAASVSNVRAEAERSLRRATELNSSAARAWNALGSILIAKGEFVEAYWAAERGIAADLYMEAGDALTASLFTAAVETGNLPAAERWCSDIRRRMQGNWSGAYCQLQILAAEDHPTQADLAQVERLRSTALSEKQNAPFAALLDAVSAISYAKAGNAARARSLLTNAENGAISGEVLPMRALALKHLGKQSEARVILTRYIQDNPSVRSGVTRSARYAGLY